MIFGYAQDSYVWCMYDVTMLKINSLCVYVCVFPYVAGDN